MKIIDEINKGNLKPSLPYGAYSGADNFKFDYSDLVIKVIDRENERKLRFDVLHSNNELHVSLQAENEEGKKVLKIVENNKEKFIGKTVDEAIATELIQ